MTGVYRVPYIFHDFFYLFCSQIPTNFHEHQLLCTYLLLRLRSTTQCALVVLELESHSDWPKLSDTELTHVHPHVLRVLVCWMSGPSVGQTRSSSGWPVSYPVAWIPSYYANCRNYLVVSTEMKDGGRLWACVCVSARASVPHTSTGM